MANFGDGDVNSEHGSGERGSAPQLDSISTEGETLNMFEMSKDELVAEVTSLRKKLKEFEEKKDDEKDKMMTEIWEVMEKTKESENEMIRLAAEVADMTKRFKEMEEKKETEKTDEKESVEEKVEKDEMSTIKGYDSKNIKKPEP